MLVKFLGIPVSLPQLAHDRGRGDDRWTLEDFARASRKLGLIARVRSVPPNKLAALPLPALAEMRDGDCLLLLKADEQGVEPRYLVQRGNAERAEIWRGEEVHDKLSGRVLLAASRESIAGAKRPFDIAWFIPALVKYRKPLRDVLVGSFFLQLMGLVSPIFFQLVIDKVLVHQSLTTLDVLAFGLAAVLLFETALSGLRTWLFAHTTNRVDSELSSKMFRHLLQLPLSYFETRRVGDSIARVRELEGIREFLTSNSMTVVIDLFFTCVFFAVMFLYSPQLTLIVLLSIPCYIAISITISKPLRSLLEEKFRKGAENQAFLVESVTGIGTLKAMAVEPQMRERWEKLFAAYTGTGFAATRLANWGSHLIQLVSKLTTVGILYFGAKAVIEGSLTVGGLVAFNMLAGRVAGPILRLSQLWQDFQQVRISVDRLADVLNAPTEPDLSDRVSLPEVRGEIRFEQVRFRYRPDAPEVLRDIDLELGAGEMIGIVGPSGSGKSTLTKLVQRLYVPDQGRVLIDGVELAMMDPSWLRRQIGVVLQENILFNRTVRDNIALGDPARPIEEIIRAAEMAGAHEFILEMNRAYDTVIEERGGNLSGGQRQRIAIARALVTDPKILIFDEATSALDAESEDIIRRNLASIAQGRTVLIIAHRLSAVRQCDRIITIEGGQVVEQGTHLDLLRAGGRYAQLHAKQMVEAPI